jgi:GNAT superfamily N-acetyltransferase
MLLMLYDFATDIRCENYLFHDAVTTHLPCPRGVFRHSRPGDEPPDKDADWLIEADGAIVASGGFLCHYNPPYGDVYMSVAEPFRRQGFGSYIVQEVKRVCYEAGKKPAARCNGDNVASRRTLERAGLVPCARLLVGQVKTPA